MLLVFQIHLHCLLQNACGQRRSLDCKNNGFLCCFLLHGVPPSLSSSDRFRAEPTTCEAVFSFPYLQFLSFLMFPVPPVQFFLIKIIQSSLKFFLLLFTFITSLTAFTTTASTEIAINNFFPFFPLIFPSFPLLDILSKSSINTKRTATNLYDL